MNKQAKVVTNLGASVAAGVVPGAARGSVVLEMLQRGRVPQVGANTRWAGVLQGSGNSVCRLGWFRVE